MSMTLIAYHPGGDPSNLIRVWTYVSEHMDPQEALEKARATERGHFKDCMAHRKNLSEEVVKTLQPLRCDAEHFFICTEEEFHKRERESLLGGHVTQITKEDWWYALEVLPPCGWGHGGGVERFYMMEAYSGTYSEQFALATIDGVEVYGKRMVDTRDKSTWITRRDMEDMLAYNKLG